MHLNLNSRKLRAFGLAGALAASVGSGFIVSGVAGAIVATPEPCYACHFPVGASEGPTVLEVGSTEMTGGIAPDWIVTGYGYTAGDTWTVQIENASTNQVYDTTKATSQSNGTIAAYSPVNPPAQPGQLSFTAGDPINPLPTCGVTLQAFLTDGTVGTSQQVALPTCPPPPPPPQ